MTLLRANHPIVDIVARLNESESSAADVAILKEHERKWLLIDADLANRDKRLGEHPRDPFDQRRRAEIREARRQVQEGIDQASGLAFPELMQSMVGLPGLRTARRLIERLEAATAAAQERAARWPTPDATRPFRYVGPRFKTTWDGDRYLEPGEVVALTEQQARAFADRFEQVAS
jgi:hypothetical protein